MASAILLAVTGWNPAEWDARFCALAPRRDIRSWPERIGNPGDIAYACTWKAPHGALAQFPNLRAIFSLGAGVDHLVADPSLPDVPIVRIVDPDLTMRMTEYAVLHVLMHHRGVRRYGEQQRQRVWRDHHQPAASEVAVGVMGLGALGRHAAAALAGLGFRIAGWSRTAKSLPGIETFHGADGLDRFLARTEILVCLLPLTAATEGLLNLSLFGKLKRDGALGAAFLINAGRGKLQVEGDIIAALDRGWLSGASLDVFPTEPLPPDSPLWTHDKIIVTPHNAAESDPHAIAINVLKQIARLEGGAPLDNVIDRRRGY
jgi:glyoxylate/hydroxypyruvate reductase A